MTIMVEGDSFYDCHQGQLDDDWSEVEGARSSPLWLADVSKVSISQRNGKKIEFQI